MRLIHDGSIVSMPEAGEPASVSGNVTSQQDGERAARTPRRDEARRLVDELRLLESVIAMSWAYEEADRAARLEDVLLLVENALSRLWPQLEEVASTIGADTEGAS